MTMSTMAISPNPRLAYGEALVALGKQDARVVALEADLSKSTQSILFKAAFPERHFEMGIAEQNMVSTAAGLALAGKIPFVHSFAVFASGRVYDQLRNSVCIPKLNVRICGSSCGLSDFGDGKTHQAVEDVALMRALPNMSVLSPGDSAELTAMMDQLLDWPGPVYIRVSRNDLPFTVPLGPAYKIGDVVQVKEGTEAAIFASGSMVSRALAAAQALDTQGVSARVLNVGTLKPLDREAVIRFARGVRAIVTTEEHSVIGGLGAAVLEALRSVRHAPVELLGIRDSFGLSAESYKAILGHFGLTAEAIAAAVLQILEVDA